MITNEVNVTRSPVQSKITVQYPGIWTVHLFFGPDKKAIKAEYQVSTVDRRRRYYGYYSLLPQKHV